MFKYTFRTVFFFIKQVLTPGKKKKALKAFENGDPMPGYHLIRQMAKDLMDATGARIIYHGLENLPEEMQAEVSKRLATMDRTSPDVLREVERVLEKKLSTLSSEDYTAAGGVESIVEILNLVDRSSEKAIIEQREEDDPGL